MATPTANLIKQTYPPPTIQQATENTNLIPQLTQVVRGFAWTQGMITASGWLPWLDALPIEQRLTLPDGTRMLAVHAYPGHDEGTGIQPHMSDDKVRASFGDADADLILVGHVHWAQDRHLGDLRVVNPGPVGNQLAPRMYAGYVVLEADKSRHQVHFHQVQYNHDAEIQALYDYALSRSSIHH